MAQITSHRALWVLNLDADYELEDPRGYTPSHAMQRRVEALAQRALGLLRPGDVLLGESVAPTPSSRALAHVGVAWCPTPRALARLATAGAILPKAPSLEVLQRVNGRRFAIELDSGPLGARHFAHFEAACEALARTSPSGRWLLKRDFGLSGRGHHRVDGAPTELDLRWLRKSFKHGHGVALEPFVERVVDVGQHGWLARSGELRIGQPVLQRCDVRGAWQESVPLPQGALTHSEIGALLLAVSRAGAALHDAGYFGPFGVDAFAYRAPDGRRTFQPTVEINARYSMGWPLSGLESGDGS